MRTKEKWPSCQKNAGSMFPRGFTLIEILVVVLIIGILGAIALPQYQRAVLKGRYSAMMPIAKALAEANEVFYLEHGNYSENPADLLVAGRDKNAGAYPDGTRVLMYDEDGLSYVRVTNDNVPNARYLVYQKHSENFPDTTQCEASDDRANELCVALGGQIIEDGNSSGESEWTAYLLSGRYGTGDQLIPAGGNDSGDDNEDDEGGENSGTNTEPQTPPCDLPTDEELAVLQSTAQSSSGNDKLTVSAQCINGKVKYEWSGGKVYDVDFDQETIVCSGNLAYACAGSEFQGKNNRCEGTQENSCAGSTFNGESSSCGGNIANGCANSTFSGYNSACFAVANGCAGSIFSGYKSFCISFFANGCADTTIQAGSYCWAATSGACDGAKYGEDPTGTRPGIGVCYESGGSCPNGAPIQGSWSGDNNTGSYTIKSWKGGYCNPELMVSGTCPSGSPKQGGGTW